MFSGQRISVGTFFPIFHDWELPTCILHIFLMVNFIFISWFMCNSERPAFVIFNTLLEFQETRKLSDGEITLHLSSEARVATVSVGVVELIFFWIKY